MPRTIHPAKNKKKTGGRPSKYKEEFVVQVYEATRHGATMESLANLLGVDVATVYDWKVRHSEFSEAIKKGRIEFDSGKVASSLLERALGTDYDEISEEYIEIDGEHYIETTEVIEGEKGKTRTAKVLTQGRKIKITHKRVLPDVMAIMYWLQNRNPEEWKNVQKQIVESHTTVDHNHRIEHDLTNLTREQLEQLRDIVGQARRSSDGAGSGEHPGGDLSLPLRPKLLASG